MKERCQEEVFHDLRHYPCSRYAWKDGYCKQHHPDTVAVRQGKSQAAWEEKRKQEPWYKLQEAHEKIAQLEAEQAFLIDLFIHSKWNDIGPLMEYKPDDEKYITKELLLAIIQKQGK